MSIDFSTLQGLTIPEGVVTQIADENGRVIWAVMTDKPIVLKVEKITADTYAGETAYTAEEFILLDIYPKTNGTVKITYGGLTKTITDTSGAEEPNAQQVFFGTLYGVSDSVATPASGELTIEGDYYRFDAGSFGVQFKSGTTCDCVYALVDLGVVTTLPSLRSVFNSGEASKKITSITIPKTVRQIGLSTMSVSPIASIYYLGNMSEWCGIVSLGSVGKYDRDGDDITDVVDFYIKDEVVTNLTIPDDVRYIYPYKFCKFSLTSVTIPDHVTTISHHAFYECIKLESVTFANPTGWYTTTEDDEGNEVEIALDLSDPANNATLISSTYLEEWYRK